MESSNAAGQESQSQGLTLEDPSRMDFGGPVPDFWSSAHMPGTGLQPEGFGNHINSERTNWGTLFAGDGPLFDTSADLSLAHPQTGLNNNHDFSLLDNALPSQGLFVDENFPTDLDLTDRPELPESPATVVPATFTPQQLAPPEFESLITPSQPIQNEGPYYTSATNVTSPFVESQDHTPSFAQPVLNTTSSEPALIQNEQPVPCRSSLIFPDGQPVEIFHWLDDDLEVLAKNWCAEYGLPDDMAAFLEQRLRADQEIYFGLVPANASNMAMIPANVSNMAMVPTIAPAMASVPAPLNQATSSADNDRKSRKQSRKAKSKHSKTPQELRDEQAKAEELRRCMEVLKLKGPLSVMARHIGVQPVNVEGPVNRTTAQRQADAHKGMHWCCDWCAPRQVNSWMMYRTAYSKVCKLYFNISTEATVSTMLGYSWKNMEPESVTGYYLALAEKELVAHDLAFPNYRFVIKYRSMRKVKRGVVPPAHGVTEEDDDE